VDEFSAVIEGLLRGDFSRLDPLFDDDSPIIAWHREGLFAAAPAALKEAVTCAAFNGRMEVLAYLLDQGVDPAGGDGTGMNALHWAVNRGQFEATRLLVSRGAPLESRNSYGGTVLDCAVWSAINEPRPDHERIIEFLLESGADLSAVELPTGNAQIDAWLQRESGES